MTKYKKSYFEETKHDAISMKKYLLAHGKKKVVIRRGRAGVKRDGQLGYRVWSLDKR